MVADIIKNPVDGTDSKSDMLAQTAMLHTASLPDSVVTRLGLRYATHFYRYIARSETEFLLLAVEDETVRGACVVTTARGSLKRRLLLRTPVIPFYCLTTARKVTCWRAHGTPHASDADALPGSTEWLQIDSRLPELLVLFTSPDCRGKGIASALIEECEGLLRARGHHEFFLKTLDDAANSAIGFYERRGFEMWGRICEDGKPFRVFGRAIEVSADSRQTTTHIRSE